MTQSSNPIPPDYPRISPYLCVDGAAAAIDFYTRAFGAVEHMRLPMGDKLGHAEVKIGDSVVMLADPSPDVEFVPPTDATASSSHLMLYVADVDTVTARAIELGATVLQPPTTQFYGDRTAQIRDPFGHRWTLASQIERLTVDEVMQRMDSLGADE